jgi:hypothetical protein
MSVTQYVGFAPAPHPGLTERHPQHAPFLLAVAIVAVSVGVALAFTGLPA